MSLAAADDAVGHSGQAVTLEAARGQHLFTRTKQVLMDWAGARAGGHVQRGDRRASLQPEGERRARRPRDRLPARLDPRLGRERRGRGARRRRKSAALFYTKLNDGHERRVFAPERHHEIVGQTLALCELRGTLAQPPADAELPARTGCGRRRRRPQPGADHGDRAGRRPRGGGRAPSATTSSTAAASTRSTSTCRSTRRRPPSSPTTSSASASPTRGSSPTPGPTATSCACSRYTGSESRPTTSPSPRTTGASCSTTCSPTDAAPRLEPPPHARRGGRRPCASPAAGRCRRSSCRTRAARRSPRRSDRRGRARGPGSRGPRARRRRRRGRRRDSPALRWRSPG